MLFAARRKAGLLYSIENNMKSELHIFIIWEKGRYLSDKILADIQSAFSIKQVYNISWPKESFGACLAKFYGKNLPKGVRKEKECGSGDFLVAVVEDKQPIHLKGLNLNMCEAKVKYRSWLNGNLIHASDNAKEGIENLETLLGCKAEDFIREHKKDWNGEIINRQANLCASGFNESWWAVSINRLNHVGRQLLQNLNLW